MTRLFRLATYIPQVQAYLDAETKKVMDDCTAKFSNLRKGQALTKLPIEATSQTVILDRVKKYGEGCKKFYSDKGNISGAVYNNEEAHWNFLSEVMRHSLISNPLHIDEFLYVTQMEAEIIRWTLDLYNGDKEACGIVTSGGTESILLAMLSYRVQCQKEKGITKPNVVCSETAHCAFDKAAFYFGFELRKIPVTKDLLADYEGIKRAVDSNTICIVASCPEYAFGTYDPVSKIAALAQSWGIGCHSDCCLGSYINPFIEELGYPLQEMYDFRVPGVTSISCDPHKYAYGPKGASICMFRTKKQRNYQLYCNTEWNGGIYATTCIAGSRPGSIICGTWAAMLKFGRNGYKEKARGILEAQKQMRLAFEEDPDIQVVSVHTSPIFSFTSSTINSIAVAEQMQKIGNWIISKLQRPPAGHLALTDASCGNWKDFVNTLRGSVKAMKADPSLNKNHDTALYGITGSIPDKRLLRDFICMHQAAMLDTLE